MNPNIFQFDNKTKLKCQRFFDNLLMKNFLD